MYNVFGLRVIFYRSNKVHCRYYEERYLQVMDMGSLKSQQRAIWTDIHFMEAGVKYLTCIAFIMEIEVVNNM